ncbi:MAG: hypothetical protein AB1847_22745 [bacterium]
MGDFYAPGLFGGKCLSYQRFSGPSAGMGPAYPTPFYDAGIYFTPSSAPGASSSLNASTPAPAAPSVRYLEHREYDWHRQFAGIYFFSIEGRQEGSHEGRQEGSQPSTVQ